MIDSLKDSSGIEDSAEYKRKQKLKRDHRRTRVIRTAPQLDEENCHSNIDTIAEVASPVIHSPIPFSEYDNNVGMTPDDKTKDPDWGNTPLRVKRRTTNAVPKKVRSTSSLLNNTYVK